MSGDYGVIFNEISEFFQNGKAGILRRAMNKAAEALKPALAKAGVRKPTESASSKHRILSHFFLTVYIVMSKKLIVSVFVILYMDPRKKRNKGNNKNNTGKYQYITVR